MEDAYNFIEPIQELMNKLKKILYQKSLIKEVIHIIEKYLMHYLIYLIIK